VVFTVALTWLLFVLWWVDERVGRLNARFEAAQRILFCVGLSCVLLVAALPLLYHQVIKQQ
jgi:hypothetical protein